MKIILLAFTIFISTMNKSFAQPCDCEKALDSVQRYTEKNYAGFADKIKMFGDAAYQKHTKRTKASAKKINDVLHCTNLLDNWLLFFKDNHLYLHYQPNAAWFKTAAIENKKISRTDAGLLLNRTINDTEGIYYKPDGSLTVAVIKQKSIFRDYAAYIIESKNSAWKPGDLHFEMKQQLNGLYKVTWYNNEHIPFTDQLDFSNGNPLLWNGWKKDASGNEPALKSKQHFIHFTEERDWPVFSKQVNDSVLYLRIKSFNVKNLNSINKMLEDNRSLLSRLPYLIIDIRGNGGGGDICYKKLKEYLYTQPVHLTGANFLATADNIAAYTKSIEEAGLPAEVAKEYLADMDKASAVQGKYYNMFPDEVDSSGSIHIYPKKVVILIDEKCASSAEQFLLEARQSKKVILAGQPTRGVLDYANVCEYKMNAYGFSLLYPTSRSRRIDSGEGIENKGIQPNLFLDFTEADWFNKILSTLK